MKSDKKANKSAAFIAGALLSGTVALNPVSGMNLLAYNDLGSGAQLRTHLVDANSQPQEKPAKKTKTKAKTTDKKAKAAETKSTEAKCGEGKCGEGKCGADAKKKATAKKTKAEDKSKEAKCGEGKCG